MFTNDSAYLTGNQTITLSGDASGSGTTAITVTVADDSHNHIISNVDGLQTALDAKLANVSEDATPQLGGNLDVNGNKIVSTSNADIDIEPNGTGNVLLGNLKFDADQTVGAGQDDYVLTYDNTAGTISLEAAASGGGGTSWQTVKTSAYTASAGEGVFADTSGGAFTLTLPSSPSQGDEVAFKDYGSTFDTNNLTIGRNGKNIEGVASDLVISVEGAGNTLVFVDDTKGWLIKNK
jgi:hypothetical protein